MRDDDRRFTRWLLAIAGPAFVAGGFLAAFTDIGAVLVFIGLGMLAAAAVLWTRLPAAAAALAGVFVTAALVVQLAVEMAGR